MSDADYRYDVFIAHATKDSAYCQELRAALTDAGLAVFLDRTDLDGASQWDLELPLAQEQSRVTLVLVTKHTKAAWFQRAEIQRAIVGHRFGSRKHEIVPIWADGFHKPYGTEMLAGIPLVEGARGVADIVNGVQKVLAERFGVVPQARFAAGALPSFLSAGIVKAPKPDGSPVQLLVASRQVVPFTERVAELAALDDWADQPGCAVKLLHGPGGVGKTRLALEWLRRRRGRNDVAGFLRGDAARVPTAQLAATNRPAVVAVDYAETRSGLSEFLRAIADDWEHDRGAVKVLLLARHDGDWWGALRQDGALRSFLDETKKLALQPLVAAADRSQEFLRAGQAFATLLGTPLPDQAPADLSSGRYDRALFIHIAALLAALGCGSDVGELLDGLLDRERAFWRRYCGSGSVEWRPREVAIEQALAALTLRGGAPSREDLDQWLPGVAGPHEAAVRRLLEHHYEGGADRWRDPLEPDLVGEHLVWLACRGGTLPAGPGPGAILIERALSGASADWKNAFAVLARAEPDHSNDIGPWLEQLVSADPGQRTLPALEGALLAGRRTAHSTLGRKLADALLQSRNVDLARALWLRIPGATVSLRELGVAAARLLLEQGELGDERALIADHLGNRLAALGQREEALATTREAVALYRNIASRRNHGTVPGLAAALDHLGVRLLELSRPEEALKATLEAVGMCRALSEAEPESFLPMLAISLVNLGNGRAALQQYSEALAANEEAAAIHERLAAAAPDLFLPLVATSLEHVAIRLAQLGRVQDGLKTAERSVAMFQQLAHEQPDAFLPQFASSLHNFSAYLTQLDRPTEALQAIEQAMQLRHQLAAARPQAFMHDLARGMQNLSLALTAVGRTAEALPAMQEALGHYQRLAAEVPNAFDPELAGCVDQLESSLRALGRDEEAALAIQQAVEVQRRLVATGTTTSSRQLGRRLHDLGVALEKLGRFDDALAATQEAAHFRRDCLTEGSDESRTELAISLDNLGLFLAKAGRYEAALEATREAVQLHSEVASRHPSMVSLELAASLDDLGLRFLNLGDDENAVRATKRAVAMHRALAKTQPNEFEKHVAMSLHNLGIQLAAGGRYDEAVSTAKEAVEILEKLVQTDRDSFLPLLASSLRALPTYLAALGRQNEALMVARRLLNLS